MSNLFNKLKSSVSDFFGFGKNQSNHGLFNKAKEIFKGGVNFLNSKSAKKGVDMLSNLTGTSGVRDFFTSAKKYGHIGNNLLNGNALDKSLNRSGLPSVVDRMADRFKNRREPTIELPQRQQNDHYNLNSIFG